MITKIYYRISLLTLFFCLCLADDALAQTSESSSIGQTDTGRAAVAAGKVGTITGRERFLRRNRRRTSFVGRDRSELSGFVGQRQGAVEGTVRTAIEGRRARFQRNVNIAAQRTNETVRTIYEPQLTVQFDVRSIEPSAIEASLARLLNESSKIRHLGPLLVTVDVRTTGAQTAMLEGVVASDADRQLAEAYLRFEPGVADVVNRLTVASPGTADLP